MVNSLNELPSKTFIKPHTKKNQLKTFLSSHACSSPKMRAVSGSSSDPNPVPFHHWPTYSVIMLNSIKQLLGENFNNLFRAITAIDRSGFADCIRSVRSINFIFMSTINNRSRLMFGTFVPVFVLFSLCNPIDQPTVLNEIFRVL